MTDLMSMLKTLYRPRLLIRAARFGMTDYSRKRDLQKLLRSTAMPSPAQAVAKLMAEETFLEDKRITGDATYSITRHVLVLIALMGEVRLMQACAKPS
ncbi:hypothetical protein JI58_06055 [Marinosulfonomonas sp. PRT-SC04]|nr:hypothetical protein JI58_06055 [Marinosulfonomonas sp. PRT-SC04]